MFYDYRDEFIKKLKVMYSEELVHYNEEQMKQKQLNTAENLIRKYFNDLEKEMKPLIEVSHGNIELIKEEQYIKFIMNHEYLKFTRFEHSIKVEMGIYNEEEDYVEARILSDIIPGKKKCVIKKVRSLHNYSTFDVQTINHYMNRMFEKNFRTKK